MPQSFCGHTMSKTLQYSLTKGMIFALSLGVEVMNTVGEKNVADHPVATPLWLWVDGKCKFPTFLSSF